MRRMALFSIFEDGDWGHYSGVFEMNGDRDRRQSLAADINRQAISLGWSFVSDWVTATTPPPLDTSSFVLITPTYAP